MAATEKGSMPESERNKLNANRVEIIRVLDPNDIIYNLIACGVMSMEDKQSIMNLNPFTKQLSAERFLDTLLKKGGDAYKEFLVALKEEGYNKLAQQIENTPDDYKENIDKEFEEMGTSETKTVKGNMSPKYAMKINKNIKSLREVLDAGDILDHFIQAQLIDEAGEEKVKRNNPNTRAKRTEAFIDILVTLDDRGYKMLIIALRRTGYGKLAEQIQNTGETKPEEKRDQIHTSDSGTGPASLNPGIGYEEQGRTAALQRQFERMTTKSPDSDIPTGNDSPDGGRTTALKRQFEQKTAESPDSEFPDGNDSPDGGNSLYGEVTDRKIGSTHPLKNTDCKLKTEPSKTKGKIFDIGCKGLGYLRAVHDETDTVMVLKRISEIEKSVGIIKTPTCSATGFRVGKNLLMTAWHVVNNLFDSVPASASTFHQGKEETLSSSGSFVDFSFLEHNHVFTEATCFYFQSYLRYLNVDLDVVILELKDNIQGIQPPPPLCNFGQVDDGEIRFIGHSKGGVKKTDKVIKPYILPDGKRAEARLWSISHIGCDGFEGIDDTDKVLFHCSLEEGASGSPGIVFGSDGRSYVVTMLTHGFPDWYYKKDTPWEKRNIEAEFMIEQGVRMEAMVKDMTEKAPMLLKHLQNPNFELPSIDHNSG